MSKSKLYSGHYPALSTWGPGFDSQFRRVTDELFTNVQVFALKKPVDISKLTKNGVLWVDDPYNFKAPSLLPCVIAFNYSGAIGLNLKNRKVIVVTSTCLVKVNDSLFKSRKIPYFKPNEVETIAVGVNSLKSRIIMLRRKLPRELKLDYSRFKKKFLVAFKFSHPHFWQYPKFYKTDQTILELLHDPEKTEH